MSVLKAYCQGCGFEHVAREDYAPRYVRCGAGPHCNNVIDLVNDCRPPKKTSNPQPAELPGRTYPDWTRELRHMPEFAKLYAERILEPPHGSTERCCVKNGLGCHGSCDADHFPFNTPLCGVKCVTCTRMTLVAAHAEAAQCAHCGYNIYASTLTPPVSFGGMAILLGPESASVLPTPSHLTPWLPSHPASSGANYHGIDAVTSEAKTRWLHGMSEGVAAQVALKTLADSVQDELLSGRMAPTVTELGKAEQRASMLADACGTLRTENDALLIENAKLRRTVEDLERKAKGRR